MARVKAPALVVTFPSTETAMRCEEACGRRGLPGRMIPVPGAIAAGCGLAWKAEPALREQLALALEADGVPYEAMTVIELMSFA